MSEIEDITDIEFDKLLQHVDFGKLDIVESCTNGQDMLKELLGVVLAPADDTLSMRLEMDPYQGSSPSLSIETKKIKDRPRLEAGGKTPLKEIEAQPGV